MARSIDSKAHDGGSFTGYLAEPAAGQVSAKGGPGILVIQEIFGVNKVMRDICDGLAAQGYVALCPDMIWRPQTGIDITAQTQEEWDPAFKLFRRFKLALGIADRKTTHAVSNRIASWRKQVC